MTGIRAEESPPAEQEPPGVQEAATGIVAQVLQLVGTRLQLAGVEIAEARERLVASLLLIGAAFAFGMLALLVATLGVVAWFWDTHRYVAIAVVTLVYAGAALLLWRRHVELARAAPPLLGATLDALRRDAQRFGPDEKGAP